MAELDKSMFHSTALGAWLLSGATSVYWLGLFTATHLPRIPTHRIPLSDKALHVIAFTGFSFLVGCVLTYRKGDRRLWGAAVLCLAYAAFDEWSQSPVGRTPDCMDWLADACGVAVGLTACFSLRQIFMRRESSLVPPPTLPEARPA